MQKSIVNTPYQIQFSSTDRDHYRKQPRLAAQSQMTHLLHNPSTEGLEKSMKVGME